MKNKNNSKKMIVILLAAIIAVLAFTAAISSIGIASEPLSTILIAEQTEEIEIEELQQWIYDQGYNYTVRENRITSLSLEERQSLCGYRAIMPPTGPLPENVDFRSMIGIPESERGSQHSIGQPSAYDAMALGNVTPVKDQGACGSCWTFGAIADFESDVLINESQEFNFSEQELGNCNIWSNVGGHDFCEGGNAFMTTNYFTKYGAADEACNPYVATPETCQNCPLLKNVDNWRIITDADGESQISTIKNAILKYGPVDSSIYARDPGFTAYDSGVYEYWGTEETTHAIQIIGWNDTLEAWMIKNSWGTDWGASGPYPGCAWVAYGAANLGDDTSAIVSYKKANDKIFYHDECGWLGGCFGCMDRTAYGAVRFVPSQYPNLTAVDFWVVDANITYEIKIFDTLNGGPTYYTFSNQLGTTQTGTTNELGYYSIPLDTPVQLVSGNDFIVQVKLTTTEYGYPIPIDYADPIPWLNWSLIAVSSGESYASCDGSQFEKYGTGGKDIGIRARAEEEGDAQPDIWVSPTSFEKELSPDDVHSEDLTIGNDGTGALNFEIQIDYMEQQTSSAKTTVNRAINFVCSDNIDNMGNGTVSTIYGSNGKPISILSKDSIILDNRVILVNDTTKTNYTIAFSEDETDTPGNTKLYLRYIDENKVLNKSKGSSTKVWIISGYGGTAEWDDHILTSDITGTSYDFSLVASSDSHTDFIAKIKVDGTTLVTGYFTCDTVHPTFGRYTGTVTGIDPTTFNGDEVTLEITFNGPDKGYIAYNGGSGDAADWYSYITIPLPGDINNHPTACFTVSPSSGGLDTIFSFDASCSSDDKDPTSDLQVRWDWENDGTYDTSYTTTKTATHQYTSTGTKTIKLQVRDTDGLTRLTNTTTKKVNVSEHDMAVTDVCTTPSFPLVGQPTTIYVTVKNEGNQAESNVPVKAYLDGSQVDSTKYVSLSAGQSTTENFSWTPSIAKRYSVKGEVGEVSGETDKADNTKTIYVDVGWLSVSPTTGTVNPGSQTNITVEFNTTGLSVGEYHANITIANIDPDENATIVPVKVKVTVLEHKVYFVPQESSALYNSETDVEIWVNATDFQSGEMVITYDPTCANVTNWVRDTANFGVGTRVTDVGSERIGFIGTALKTGEYRIGTLTLRCTNESTYTETTINFVEANCSLFGSFGSQIEGVTWVDGVFGCTPGMCGDVNCNGEINIGDVTLLLSHWSDTTKYPLCNDWAGDVNCNGEINIGDVTLLLSHWGDPAKYPLSCC